MYRNFLEALISNEEGKLLTVFLFLKLRQSMDEFYIQ